MLSLQFHLLVQPESPPHPPYAFPSSCLLDSGLSTSDFLLPVAYAAFFSSFFFFFFHDKLRRGGGLLDARSFFGLRMYAECVCVYMYNRMFIGRSPCAREYAYAGGA